MQASTTPTPHVDRGMLPRLCKFAVRCCLRIPTDPRARSLAGLCMAEAGEVDEGRPLIEQAVAAEPGNWRFLLNLSVLREMEGRNRRRDPGGERRSRRRARSVRNMGAFGPVVRQAGRPRRRSCSAGEGGCTEARSSGNGVAPRRGGLQDRPARAIRKRARQGRTGRAGTPRSPPAAHAPGAQAKRLGWLRGDGGPMAGRRSYGGRSAGRALLSVTRSKTITMPRSTFTAHW